MSINTVCSSTNRGRRLQPTAHNGPDSTGHCSRHSMYCYGHRHIPYYKIVSSILYWNVLEIIEIFLIMWMMQRGKGKEVWKEKKIHVPVNALSLKWSKLSFESKRFLLNHAFNFCCVWSDIKGSLKQPLLWFMVSTWVYSFSIKEIEL